MGRIKVFRYVGEPRLTRGDYGVRIDGGHTRLSDPSSIYVFDPDFGDMRICAVADARRFGFRFLRYEEAETDPALA